MIRASDVEGDPVVRGTRAEPFIERPTYPFRSAAGLVRWWFGAGRDAVGSVRGIDYGRDGRGVARDFYALEEVHIQYALVTSSVNVVGEVNVRLLQLAYQVGKSDLQIAERLNLSRRVISRRRMQALRAIEVEGRRHELLPPEGACAVC